MSLQTGGSTPEHRKTDAHPGSSWLLLIAAFAGACTMGVEIAAVRLLAPWFGASLIVWTNVLEVILCGLAVGYLLGAQLSRSREPLARLAVVLGMGALFTAWLPALSGPICALFLPRDLALHDAAPLLLWGSLASALLLFLPPATMLGAVGPLLVEELQRRGGLRAGTAGGRVLAASTFGSVAGAFLTSHVGIPSTLLGLRRTFALAAIVLAICCGVTWIRSRRGQTSSICILIAVVTLSFLIRGDPSLPASREGIQELARGESIYQHVRVVEDSRSGKTFRYLQVNEGFDSFQSVWQAEEGLLGKGFYYDDFALPVWWSRGAHSDQNYRVLVLGFGAGSVYRVLSGVMPAGMTLDMIGIEIDAMVVDLGRLYFDLPSRFAKSEGKALEIHSGLDARFALRCLDGPFDEIVLDAYANQIEIPPHLSTVEFFREVREQLASNGWLVTNIGGFGFDDPIVVAVAESVAFAFEQGVLLLRVPQSRNVTLFARRDIPPPTPQDESWGIRGQVGDLLAPREIEGGWMWIHPPETPMLTDDRNPIESLQLRSLREARERMRSDT